MSFPARGSEETLPGFGAAPASERAGRRRLVSPAELQRWLTAEIRKHEGCGGVRVIAITRLHRAGPDGCNWSYSLVVEPAGVPPRVYAMACIEVVTRGRALFNVSL
jgi:hypothetical protein